MGSVEELLDQAHQAWPSEWLSRDAFAAHLAMLAGDDASTAIAVLRGPDVYVVAAALAGVAPAYAALEEMIHRTARVVIGRMRGSNDAVDEVAREMSEKLLVGTAERGPRIAEYQGRGSLSSWLGATASRTFLNQQRKHKREVLIGDEAVLDAVGADAHSDAALAHMKALYREEFATAFEAALRGLDDRQRAILRYRFVDGVTVEKIAAIYRVHRGTCHTWISDARAALANATERALQARLALTDSELVSIRRLVESQLELSLSRIFR